MRLNSRYRRALVLFSHLDADVPISIYHFVTTRIIQQSHYVITSALPVTRLRPDLDPTSTSTASWPTHLQLQSPPYQARMELFRPQTPPDRL
jgi:hypothetical protein